MKAVIIDEPLQARVGEWETVTPKPGEVRVAIQAAGICAGDMYIYHGKNPYATYPRIGGHELCGTVVDWGEGANGFTAGELVVVEPFVGCGKCYPCRIGKTNCCAHLGLIGTNQPGGFADFVCGPAKNIHRVPPGLSAVAASLAEPIAIGVQACRRAQLQSGELVLILGAGPIGLALIEVARAKGAQPVVTDLSDERLEFAKTLGARALKADDALLQNVLDLTHGEGAPVVIEATGNPKAMEQTVDLVASGGRIVIVGLVKRGTMIPFPGLDFTRKEMTLCGSRASVNCFPESLELLASGKIHYAKVAREFPMWQAPEIFARMSAEPNWIHKGILIHE